MGLDFSIPMGFRPTAQIEPPANALAKVLEIQGMQQQNALGQMKMDEYRRGIEEQTALRSALSAPDADPYKVLLQRGNVKGATDFRKAEADRQKVEAEAKHKQLETAHKRLDLTGQSLGWLLKNPSPQNAQMALKYLVDNEVMPPEKAQAAWAQFQADPTPEGIARFAELGFRAALSAKDQLPKINTSNTGGQTVTQAIDPITGKPTTTGALQNTQDPNNIANNARMAADAAASRAVQIRGQNLADERAREATAAAMTKPFEITGPDGNPILVQQDKQGNIRPVQGYSPRQGASKPLTDAQAKANLFGSRMAESHRILTDLEGKYSPMAVNAKMGAAEVPLIGGAAGYAGNLMLSSAGQQAEQAQRDFINAVLRRESGAVISPAEFSNGQKQYFPQPGDNKAVLDQKRRNRELAIRGMEAEVPGGLRSAPGLTTTGQQGGSGGRSASGRVTDEDPLGIRNGR